MSVLKRLTSSFYAQGARWLGGTDGVDRAIAEGVHAKIEANTVTFTWPDGREEYHHMQVGARGRAAKWCNEFNERVRLGSRPASDPPVDA